MSSEFWEKKYKTGEVAKIFGVTLKTVQRWDKTGKLVAFRNPANHRYYEKEQIEKALLDKKKNKEDKEDKEGGDII